MNTYHLTLFKGCMLLSLLTTGCATSKWDTQSASSDFIDGTRILAEVVLIASRDQVVNNKIMPHDSRNMLLSAGYADSDIVDGSQATLWAYCFGWNSGVPTCAHTGHYFAYVPLQLREGLLGSDNWEETGDLVEVELTKTANEALVGKVVAVYRESSDWGSCRKQRYQPASKIASVLSAVSLIGPPRAIWIECENLQAEGWLRRPVRGAPLSAGSPISEWVKLPQ